MLVLVMIKKPTKKQLDNLWQQAIKLRDRGCSQWSLKKENLHAHHIIGKATYRLRWELDAGITITGGEHRFIAHGDTTRATKFQDWALDRKKYLRDKLERLKGITGGSDLFGVAVYLKFAIAEFKKLKNVPGQIIPYGGISRYGGGEENLW